MTEMGREKSGKNVLNWMKSSRTWGRRNFAYFNDQDGTLSNPDFELIKFASKVQKFH